MVYTDIDMIFFVMFYDNNILLYTFAKFHLNINARAFFLSKMCQKVVNKSAKLTQNMPVVFVVNSMVMTIPGP